MNIALPLIASILYSALSITAWYRLPHHRQWTVSEQTVFFISIVIHTTSLFFAMHLTYGIKLGFAQVLSLTSLIGVGIFAIESRFFAISSLRIIIFPFAAICNLLSAVFPAQDWLYQNPHTWMLSHFLLSIIAFSILFISFCHAWMVNLLHHYLHTLNKKGKHSLLRRLLPHLPPLLVLEGIFFRLLLSGFIALTLSIIAGISTSLFFYQRFLPFNHKVIFTLMAWGIFAILLAGHYIKGWRGKEVMRWNITAFSLLVLAYAGSQFVLEVILHRAHPL